MSALTNANFLQVEKLVRTDPASITYQDDNNLREIPNNTVTKKIQSSIIIVGLLTLLGNYPPPE